MADTFPSTHTLSTKTIFALRDPEAAVAEAAALLRNGGIVVVPTETVYGLAAVATNPMAVRAIFRAKGRPADNPLIVHIADVDMLQAVAQPPNTAAQKLMAAFWPGPLSLVLPKAPGIPAEVTAGLETVAVRMPDNEILCRIIREVGVPLAAPSANRSGLPSPTTAMHAFEDMAGRVPLVIDGGPCSTGVESTVVDCTGEIPMVLRPGDITPRQIARVAGGVRMHGGGGDTPASPGMKYRHYAPGAHIYVFFGGKKDIAQTIKSRYDVYRDTSVKPVVLCATNHVWQYTGMSVIDLGQGAREVQQNLFGALREADARGHGVILFHYTQGMGLAVKNRIMKAAEDGA